MAHLVEGALFQKLPLNEVQAYESRFQEALLKLKAEQEATWYKRRILYGQT